MQNPPSAGSFFPCGVGLCDFPGTWVCSPTQMFSEAYAIGIFMEAASCRHDQLLTVILAPLPSLEKWVR